jgi:predicted Fe-Mo cluster-binding NifX family protein
MKIALPVDENNLESSVCPSFGRAPYFLFFETDTNESYCLENSAAASPGGAGIKAAQTIADEGARALLTPRCGENAEAVLRKSDVRIYKTIPGTAKQNLDAFAGGRLGVLGDFHPGFHGHEK